MSKIDVRTKLLISAILSLLALIKQSPASLLALLVISIIVLLIFKARIQLYKGLRNLIFLYFFLIVIQSLFVQEGAPVLQIGHINLVTKEGLVCGASVILRFLILISSGLLLTTCSSSELLVALVKLKMPYDIVFMIQLGIRYIPVLTAEMQETLNSVQLKGVDLRKVYKRKIIKVYAGIFSPILYGIWKRSQNMSAFLELRGFRKYETRTYLKDISLKRADYLIMAVTIIAAAVFLKSMG